MARLGIGLNSKRTAKKAAAVTSLPTISISQGSAPVSNGGTFSITFTRDILLGQTLNFSYTVSAITTDNADMAAGAGAYGSFNDSFTSGQGTKTITIVTANNPTGEVDEFFSVVIDPGAAYNLDAVANAVICTIVGPPQLPAVSIDSFVAGTEGSQNITVTFRRTGSTAATLDLTYSIAGATGGGLVAATSQDVDKWGSQVIQFPISQSTVTDTITVVDDTDVEATEGLSITLVPQVQLYTLTGTTTVNVPIYDNEPPGPQYEPTTPVSTTNAVDGVTFSFVDTDNVTPKAMPVGYFVNGDPFVVSTSAFKVAGTNIPSVLLDGYQAHGMMLASAITAREGPQGFDGLMQLQVGNSPNQVTYSSALNVDPGNTGVPFAVAAGQSLQLIKSVRVTGRTGANWQTVDRYVVLTVLAQYPLAGPFRPSIKKTAKDIPGYESQLNYSVLRNFSPVTGGYTIADGLAAFPRTHPYFSAGGDFERKWRTDQALGGENNYGGNTAGHGNNRLKAFHALHLNATNSAKRDLLIRCVQFGIDSLKDEGAGSITTSGAGQFHGTLPYVYLAAFALGDASILAAAKNTIENMNGQTRWVQQFMIGAATSWYGNHEIYCGTWFDELLDAPVWRPDTITAQSNKVNTDENSYPSADYRTQSSPAGPMELFCTLLLQNGPNSETGVTALLGGGPFDKTNLKAAAIAYMDLYREYHTLGNAGSWAPGHRALYDAYRDTAFSGSPIASRFAWKPETMEFTGTIPMSVTAAAGAFNWSLTASFGKNGGGPGTGVGASQVITSVDLRYSIDQRAWTVVSDIANTGTVSGLINGQKYYVQFRRSSAAGTSPWTPNHSYKANANTGQPIAERLFVTPNGTGSNAAPTNSGGANLPVVTIRKYPFWAGPSWETSPATVDETQNILYAGVGFWAGFPALTFGYQWQRNSVDIAGEINDFYILRAADVGAAIRCVVTATNSQGSNSATSAAVTVPTGTGKVGTYVPGVRATIDARVATTANITLSGVGQTIDTVVIAAGDTVFAKNQTAAAENGLYVAAAGAWTRLAAASTWNQMVGLRVRVTAGSQAGTTTSNPQTNIYASDAVAGGTLGTTAINFVQFGISPPNFTKRWDALAGSPIPLFAAGSSLYFPAQSNQTNAIRFYSLDFTQPMGSLASVSEGIITLKTKTANGTLSNQKFGVVCRASGAAADGSTATGYFLEYTVDQNGSYLACLKYSNSATPTTLTTTDSQTLLHSVSGIAGAADSIAKFQFYMSGTTLILRAKIWRSGNDEPGWMCTYSDASPHPAGWVGLGTRASRSQRTFSGGITIDITPSITNTTQEESSLSAVYY